MNNDAGPSEKSGNQNEFSRLVAKNSELIAKLDQMGELTVIENILIAINYVHDSFHKRGRPILDPDRDPQSFVNLVYRRRDNSNVSQLAVEGANIDLTFQSGNLVPLGSNIKRLGLLGAALIKVPGNYCPSLSKEYLIENIDRIKEHEGKHMDAAKAVGWGGFFSWHFFTDSNGLVIFRPGVTIFPKKQLSVSQYNLEHDSIVQAVGEDLSDSDRLDLIT